jgi:CheY-like chemotaxis protein
MSKKFTDFGILYIDDEVKSLKYFEAIFEDIAPIYIASSPEEGFEIFTENHHRIGLVLSDKKMPNESGLELLSRIRAVDPAPLRFLVTAFSDLEAAVDALNDGLLYSYLTKPWDPDDLEHRLIKAMGHFMLAREREKLVREKAEALNHLIMADKAASIGILSAGLNHHLRNSLTVMRTFYDLIPYQLEEELDGEPKDQDFWDGHYREVGGQIERMTSMLTNLEESTKISDLSVQQGIDLAEILRNSGEHVLGGDPQISFSVNEANAIPPIDGDLPKIAQMGRFLFEEAKSGMGKGGEIEVLLTATEEGETVEITFLDSGKLVPELELERLFDPFFIRQSKPEELGTNLMACYLTAFYHGGSIHAERTADNRNAIIVSLPVNRPAEVTTEMSRRILDRVADFSSHDLRPHGAALTA